MKFDYLIVGAGLFGSMFAYHAKKAGKKCLVIDKRPYVGGNLYCENIEGINVHKYGAHIFHTSNKKVWDFVNSLVEFNRYTNSPLAYYKGSYYNLPFNMNTFYAIWGVGRPNDVKKIIEKQRAEITTEYPKNLEEKAISQVGREIYELLIKGYSEKQWGRKCTDIPAFIINRIPLRYTFDNNYFNDKYQGIPVGGYNVMIDKLLNGIEKQCNIDFFSNRHELEKSAKKIVFTGKIDEYFNYRFGRLDYRSLKFEHEIVNCENYQGNAVVNYTDKEVPYTRIIEHKHFEFGIQPKTVITREYSLAMNDELDPYYPINDEHNNNIFGKYQELANQIPNVIFGGRLAEYKYYDIHQIIKKFIK